MQRKFEVHHKGIRYWATTGRHPSNGLPCLIFWSNRNWPFYHGHYTPDVIERDDCWTHFVAWLPFTLKEKEHGINRSTEGA